ncbi:hypothetical protein A3K63_02345 [Candidatus Micrarchaeota archaeon RBG_16_49_10]|nr:MAG: hypothetical protein A3K63_02345 [Candidatus Micrarchaeota archaeon RBG_16_49_10]
MKTTTLGAILLILLLVASSAIYTAKAATSGVDSEEEKRTLYVNGVYTASVDPDTFVAIVTVETQAAKAADAQKANADISARVEKAVKFTNKLSTVSYTIQPVYEWQRCVDSDYRYPCTEKPILVGYKAVHTYKFETKELKRGGEALDAFVTAGATNINSITFELSPELQTKVQLEALENAAKNAKTKAVVIAKGSEVTLGKPISISEGYYYVPMRYDYAYDMKAGGAAESAPTNIIPGQVDVSASVSVTYEIF